MGRPKKTDLQCTICNKAFLKKCHLEEHMKRHSSIMNKSKPIKTYPNWCHICNKNFEDSEYKSHFQTEHQFDFRIQGTSDTNDDLFSCENGYVLLSKRRIKKEVDRSPSVDSEGSTKKNIVDFDISLTKIKIEPPEIPDQEEYKESLKPPKKVSKPKTPYIKCRECGLRCKGLKGLKIHTGMTHKLTCKDSDTSQDDEDQSELEELDQQPNKEHTEINSAQDDVENSMPCPNDAIVNLNPNTHPGLFYGTLPLNNILTVGNQSNVPILPTENVKILEVFPKFDCESENYIKWLKKFIYKCKIHKYPLPPVMCENIIHVLNEISNAVGCPVGPLRKKSNHFYFMKIHKILSEIIMGHMRHSLSIVIR